MTVLPNIDNLYDPLLAELQFQPLCADTGFSLSAWGSSSASNNNNGKSTEEEDEDDDESRDGKANRMTVHDEKPNGHGGHHHHAASGISPPATTRSVITSSCRLNARVRFLEEPEIRSYQQADREDFAVLFYSVHELQKMIDDAKKDGKATACCGSLRFDD